MRTFLFVFIITLATTASTTAIAYSGSAEQSRARKLLKEARAQKLPQTMARAAEALRLTPEQTANMQIVFEMEEAFNIQLPDFMFTRIYVGAINFTAIRVIQPPLVKKDTLSEVATDLITAKNTLDRKSISGFDETDHHAAKETLNLIANTVAISLEAFYTVALKKGDEKTEKDMVIIARLLAKKTAEVFKKMDATEIQQLNRIANQLKTALDKANYTTALTKDIAEKLTSTVN